jgi:hypothetical protein
VNGSIADAYSAHRAADGLRKSPQDQSDYSNSGKVISS